MTESKVLKIYKATPMQNGMLYYTLLNEDSINYHIQICFILEGVAHETYLLKAWQEVINRHEILRTDFKWKEFKQPIQVILQEKAAEIYTEDLTHLPLAEQQRYLERFKSADLHRSFNFEENKLNRMTLLKLSADSYFMCWSFHHLLLDGWSTNIIFADLNEVYTSMVRGKPLPPSPSAQFSTYLEWLKGQSIAKSREFWRQYIAQVTEPTFMPFGRASAEGEVIKAAKILSCELDEETTCRLNDLCVQHQITLNAFFQSIWGLLLQKYNRKDVSCFGMTVSGRPAQINDVERIAGLFINTLPVVVKSQPTERFCDLLTRVNKELLEIREYEYTPLLEIKRLSKFAQTDEFFDSIVVFENYPIQAAAESHRLAFQVKYDSAHELTNYDVTVLVSSAEKTLFRVMYNPERLPQAAMEQLCQHLRQLSETILAAPSEQVGRISLLSPAEKNRLLVEVNATEKIWDSQLIQELIEAQVARVPQKPALHFAGKTLTYAELNARANQLAYHLRQRGVKPDTVVGIMTERCPGMVIGILAILKAGGAFLPIDPEYPIERVNYMLKDSGVTLLLTEKEFCVPNYLQCTDGEFKGEMIDIHDAARYQGDSTNPIVVNELTDLAYIIYTSGSTGRPKGVMIEQRALVNFVRAMAEQVDFASHKSILALTTICFDIFILETLLPLTCGQRIVLANEDEQMNPALLLELLKNGDIQMVQMTPSRMQALLNETGSAQALAGLTDILIGGEAVPQNLVDQIINCTDAQVFNVYGPTEATVWATVQNLREVDDIVAGKPLANTRLYVLDHHFEPLPTYVPGELYIGGTCLARGYGQNPALTSERFLPDPFLAGARMYRTGDLASWLADGTIKILGRVDQQVKVRGYRIELAEIENQLLQLAQIKEAVVLDKVDAKGHAYLCAYLRGDVELSPLELREFLQQFLPDYMIPSYFIYLLALPLLPNGKINRRALPEPGHTAVQSVTYRAPRNEVEEQLVAIFKEVLEVEQIGIDDNFFELGGDSLKAIQVIARANQRKMPLSVRDILKQSTIANMWEKIIEPKQGTGVLVAEKKQAKKIFEPDQYPYYFPCIYGVMREKLRYELDYSIDKGYFMAAVGDCTLGCAHSLNPDGTLNLRYVSLPYGMLAGFPGLGERFGVTMDVRPLGSKEEALRYCDERLARGEIVLVTGTSYFLNYTPDYYMEAAEWLDRMDKGRIAMIQLEREVPHIFLLIDHTEDGYTIYDSTYNYYGLIPSADFENAFRGLQAIEFMQGHPSAEKSTPYMVLEMDASKLRRLNMRELGAEVLAKTITEMQSSRRITYQDGDTEFTVQLGLAALIEVQSIVHKHSNHAERYAELFNYLTEIFTAWKYKYIFLLDFLRDFQQQVGIEVEILADVEETIEHFEQLRLLSGESQATVSKPDILGIVGTEIAQLYSEQTNFFDKLQKNLINSI